MALFSVGDVAVIDFDLTLAETGAPIDPGTITLSVTTPSGVTTTPTPTHDGVGSYRYELSLTEAGDWYYSWTTTGTAAQFEDGTITARTPGASVINLSEVKARLNKTLTVDDDELQQMLDSALGEYAELIGPIGEVTARFHGGGASIILPAGVTAVTAAAYDDGTEIDLDDLDLDTATGILHWGYNTAGAFTTGVRNVTLTYTVALPANHREAIIADVAGYFAATQRGGGPNRGPYPGDDYADAYEAPGSPLTLFPRIRALAARMPSIA